MLNTGITLGYWPVRGKAGLLSALLAYLELQFTLKEYTDPNEWFGKDKQSLGFDYPNLLYIIDGERR